MESMKLSAFITYLILFFSILIVLILMIFGWNVIVFYLLKKDWFNSKLAAESLSSILNGIFSSTYNVSLFLVIPKDYEIIFYEENVTVKVGDSYFSSKIFKPSYIKIVNSPIVKKCSEICEISILKISDEIYIT